MTERTSGCPRISMITSVLKIRCCTGEWWTSTLTWHCTVGRYLQRIRRRQALYEDYLSQLWQFLLFSESGSSKSDNTELKVQDSLTVMRQGRPEPTYGRAGILQLNGLPSPWNGGYPKVPPIRLPVDPSNFSRLAAVVTVWGWYSPYDTAFVLLSHSLVTYFSLQQRRWQLWQYPACRPTEG